MKTHFFVCTAFSVSLSLTACTPTSFPTSSPQTASSQHSAPVQNNTEATQQVFFEYRTASPFTTQAVDTQDVAFIKLTLVGEGLSGVIENVGGFIPVTQGKAAASIRNVPIQPGKLRIVSVQGYDTEQQPLPAFVGKGIYTSRSGQVTININIDRRQLLAGLTLENLLLNQPEQVSTVDLAALLLATDTATGFDGENFTTDPLLLDIHLLREQLLNGSLNPASLMTSQITGKANFSISTLGGGRFTEALTLTINDPLSASAEIALNAASPEELNFRVAPGKWKAQLKKADGTVIGTADVEVTPDGKTLLSNESFTLNLKPEVTTITPAAALNTGSGKVTLNGSGFSGTTEVRMGATPIKFILVSDSEIELEVPNNVLGQTGITVVTPGGVSASQMLTVVDKPQISTVSLSAGAEGDKVVLTGLAFDPILQNNQVYFGSSLAEIVTAESDASKLTVKVPDLKAGSQPVSIQVAQRTSVSQAFNVKPKLAKLETPTGFLVKGLTLKLDAKGLDTTQAAHNTVNFVNTSVNPPQTLSVAGLAFDNNWLVVQVPASLSAGTYALSVTVNSQVSNTLNLPLPQVGVNLSGGLF
jgi:hypothetical protein